METVLIIVIPLDIWINTEKNIRYKPTLGNIMLLSSFSSHDSQEREGKRERVNNSFENTARKYLTPQTGWHFLYLSQPFLSQFFLRPGCPLWWRWPLWHLRVVQCSIVVPVILLQALGTLWFWARLFICNLQPLCRQNLRTSMGLFSSRRRKAQDLAQTVTKQTTS